MSGETIPDDVRAAAAHALHADSYHPELVFLIEPVALVILAERERCAAIAEDHYETDGTGPECQGCGEYIAAAIRKSEDR